MLLLFFFLFNKSLFDIIEETTGDPFLSIIMDSAEKILSVYGIFSACLRLTLIIHQLTSLMYFFLYNKHQEIL